jgi:hypothetical protein
VLDPLARVALREDDSDRAGQAARARARSARVARRRLTLTPRALATFVTSHPSVSIPNPTTPRMEASAPPTLWIPSRPRSASACRHQERPVGCLGGPSARPLLSTGEADNGSIERQFVLMRANRGVGLEGQLAGRLEP